MELRLIIGYTLLLIFIGVLASTGFFRWRRARNDFHKRWGKQKLRQRWVPWGRMRKMPD